MKMKKIIETIAFMFYLFAGLAQDKPEITFEQGSRICFVGNSITHAGGYHHNLLLFYMTRFPEIQLTFYNCGIGGDIAASVLKRMDGDILVNQPTHAVIMLGMNDLRRSLYKKKETVNADTLRMRQTAIDIYKKDFEKIITIFLSKNIKVILQKPTIYDQTAVLPSVNYFGVNDALKHCVDFIDSMAYKHNLPVVDYYSILNTINAEMQKKNPSATIIGSDRVHPATAGHLIMAYQFLKAAKAPQYVSRITVGKNTAKSSKKSFNCDIKELVFSKNELTFQVKENALPFPVTENQRAGLELVPFDQEFNVEQLQVLKLKPGNYQLSIDGLVIGDFSDKQLNEGINLAGYVNTPQNSQATKLREKLNELWVIELKLRDLKFIEYNQEFIKCPKKEDLSYLKTYLDSAFAKGEYSNYYRTQVSKYITDKPKQKEMEETAEVLKKEAFRMAQPGYHIFNFRKL